MSTPTGILAEYRAQRAVSKPASRTIKPWYQNMPLVAGAIVVGVLVLIAVLAPVIAPYDPIAQNLQETLQSPSSEHWLGTDKFGRDVFSRLIWGARVDLRVGFIAVIIPFTFGTIIGGLAGYFGGWFDIIVMRIVDVFFAFPFFVMIIALVFIFGAGESSIYLAIAIVSWVAYAKIVRGEVIVAKEQDYVVGAQLGGMSHMRILFRHIGPNVLSQAIIYAMSDIVMDIMAIVALGYLGLGIAPPVAEWGSMILEGQEFITTHWMQATVPGLIVVVTSLGVSWLGDGLSDLLNPDRRK
ncbi:ABC transporter permease [Microbacterium sp. MPKO10]|uniref:ABC transporter permease n=1 Tax=Microbacterium sp. MPKO10 TaxID=2989818 RepID=UPI00223601F7|nr:ABC transporter permease [Microbacterium sp. MPKO10]MCW4456832.1 ABC transporter permease [Microbacterium sp. MPKO10]